MADEPDNKLLYETLKKVQAGIVDLRNAVTDVRQDTRAIKDESKNLLWLSQMYD